MSLACYSRPDTPFGAPGPFYTPGVGHRGQDYDASVGDAVCAYQDMWIEYTSSTSGLGRVLGARLDDGGYAGWAHLRNIRSFVNGFVPAGTQFAEVAGIGDSPGSLWSGPHIHTTRSPESAYNAAVGNLPLQDPKPGIDAALNGTAQSAAKEFLMSAEFDHLKAQLDNLTNALLVDNVEITTSTGKTKIVNGMRGVLKETQQTVANSEAILAVDGPERGGIRATLAAIVRKLGI